MAITEPGIQTLNTGPAGIGALRNGSPVVHLAPEVGWSSLNLRELWDYSELIYFFIWRDVKVRYKQTLLGVAWAVIQPVFSMVVFTMFFGKLARMDSDGIPYPIFNLAALVPWTLFANGLNQVSNSLVDSSNLIKKVYFPRLVVPIGSLLSGMVDFALAFIILLGMILYYDRLPTINTLFVPLFVLLALVASLGIGLWLAALNVQYRDVRYVVPFIVQLWLFASPVVYSSSMVPAFWRPFYGINPMVGVIEGMRWALLGTDTAPGLMIIISSTAAFLLLISGAFYFRRMERRFADIL